MDNPLHDAAVKLCKAFPEAQTRTLARKMSKEYGIPVEAARSRIRTIRGANGKRHRQHAKAKRKPGKAGWKPEMPPSLAEPWTPFEIPGKRIGVLSDIHIPYHAGEALAVAVSCLKDMGVDCLFLNGDYGDWYSVSRWQKNPKKRNLKKELDLQKQGLEWLRHEFPKIPIVMKAGNHEERWQVYLWNHAPDLHDVPQTSLQSLLELDNLGVEFVGDQRPCMAGKLPIFHGHELPKGLTNPVSMARGAFLRAVHSVLVGHGHRTSSHTEGNLWHQQIQCWSTGCLCDMRPEFARINKWNWGFARVEVSDNGSFSVRNKRISKDGEVWE